MLPFISTALFSSTGQWLSLPSWMVKNFEIFVLNIRLSVLFIAGKMPDETTALAINEAFIKGLPPPGTADELQRTIYIGNIDPSTTSDMIMEFFEKV